MRKLLVALLVSAICFGAQAQVGPTGGVNLASPGPIGGTTPAAGTFTSVTDTGLTAGRINYNCAGGQLCDSANLTYVDSAPLVTVGSGTTTLLGLQVGNIAASNAAICITGVVCGTANYSLLLQTSTNNTMLASPQGGTGTVKIRPNPSVLGTTFDSSGLSPETDGALAIGKPAARLSGAFLGADGLSVQGTNAATAGAVTINQSYGSVKVASTASSVVVTDSKVVATDNIIAVSQQVDATCAVKAVVPGSGTFTITMTTTCTADNRVAFFRINLTN